MAKILVVDDDKDILELVAFLLEKDGHTVLTARNGMEGLEMVDKEPPQIILLDVMMPEMDGFTFHNMLLQNPRTKKIPIVILTAKVHLEDIFFMSSNVKEYINKPFDNKVLREKVKDMAASARSN